MEIINIIGFSTSLFGALRLYKLNVSAIYDFGFMVALLIANSLLRKYYFSWSPKRDLSDI